MISVEEAKKIIEDCVQPLEAVKCTLGDAWDTTLAEDIYGSQDIPAYPQSSMDGYAFSFSDLEKQKRLGIAGESAAGSRKPFTLSPGSASRIFTGAAIPDGADTVIMQEKVKVTDGYVVIDDENITKGSNVRSRGSEIKKGELALSRGSYLSAASVGFLAGIGITHVMVHPKPKIIIIVTGNELKDTGEQLQYGEVYESNSFAILAALKQFHFSAI
ncbi:MAG TPA: molybdopterin molybdotransferase MoeA, partial [Flavitalea sp.]|nr:molybdopterin molybdotransferase MoeA [Flavitalea sp.]